MRTASWTTWEEPDRGIAVAHWTERDIAVVFPLQWGRTRSVSLVVQRAKARLAEVERLGGGKRLAPGSVLVAFSEHRPQPTTQRLDPEIARRLI